MNIVISVLFYLTLFAFSLGQFGRISFYNQQVNIHLYEILLALQWILLTITYWNKPFLKKLHVYHSVVVFLGCMLLSFILSLLHYTPFQNFVGSLYLLRLFLYFGYFLYIKHHLSLHHPQYLKFVLPFVMIFTLLTSFGQYLLYPNLRNLEYLGWDPHEYRLFGLFFDPPTAAGIFGLFALYLISLPLKNKTLMITKWVGFVLFGVCILLTISRSSYIAFLLMSLYVLLRKKVVYAVLLIAVFAIGLILLPKPGGEGVNLTRVVTVESRLADQKEGFQVFLKHPVLGIGYDHIRYEKPSLQKEPVADMESNHAGAGFHSSFLIVLATGGIVSLTAFILMLIYLGRMNVVSTLLVSYVSILSLSDNVLLHPFIMYLLFTLLALSFIRPFDTSR